MSSASQSRDSYEVIQSLTLALSHAINTINTIISINISSPSNHPLKRPPRLLDMAEPTINGNVDSYAVSSGQQQKPQVPTKKSHHVDRFQDLAPDHPTNSPEYQNDELTATSNSLAVEEIPIRVALSKLEDDGHIVNIAQEIFMIDANIPSRRTLAYEIRQKFRNLERGDFLTRANIHAAWGKDLQSSHIKAIWDTAGSGAGASWGNSLSQTEITDKNLAATMKAFQMSPPSTCALSFQLARVVPDDLRDV